MKEYAIIRSNLKDYGDNTKLWYHSYQGQKFVVVMNTRKGYLVRRPDLENLHLIKHKHADIFYLPDDDMV